MTTFSSYQSLRADLSSNCNLLETAWREATRSTEMEDFLGAGVSDGSGWKVSAGERIQEFHDVPLR